MCAVIYPANGHALQDAQYPNEVSRMSMLGVVDMAIGIYHRCGALGFSRRRQSVPSVRFRVEFFLLHVGLTWIGRSILKLVRGISTLVGSNTLYYIILYHTILYNVVLYYAILYHFTLLVVVWRQGLRAHV